MKNRRNKLLNALKNTGLVVSLVGVMACSNFLVGCADSARKPQGTSVVVRSSSTLTFYDISKNSWVVVDGVLHYGNVSKSDSVYCFELVGDDLIIYDKFETDVKIFTRSEKPARIHYEQECEECMSHLGQL